MIMDQDGTADFANLGIVDMRWNSSSRANSMSPPCNILFFHFNILNIHGPIFFKGGHLRLNS